MKHNAPTTIVRMGDITYAKCNGCGELMFAGLIPQINHQCPFQRFEQTNDSPSLEWLKGITKALDDEKKNTD